MAAKAVTIEELLKKVKEVEITSIRLNDLAEGVVVKVATATKDDSSKEENVRVQLSVDDKKTMNTSLYALASLRIIDAAADIADLKFSADATGSTKVRTLQDLIMQSDSFDLSKAKFKVASKLPVINNLAKESDTPVYQNNCYSGHKDYVAETAEIRANTELVGDALNNAYSAARNKLLATPLKDGKAEAKNQVMIPLFTVSQD